MSKKQKKTLGELKEMQSMNKSQLIDKLLQSTIKGGCCNGGQNPGLTIGETAGVSKQDVFIDDNQE